MSAGGALLLAVSALRATTPPPTEEDTGLLMHGQHSASPVKLPPFVVTDVKEGLPWMYARVGDFEVLTLCSVGTVRDFLQAQWRGWHFLPEEFHVKRASPVQVVIWGGDSREIPPAVHHSYAEGGYNFGNEHISGWYVPDIIADTDGDTLLLSANLKLVGEYETAAIQYARVAAREVTPEIPLWFREGLMGDNGLYPGDLGIQTIIGLDKIILPQPSGFDALMPGNRARRSISLAELFGAPPDRMQEPGHFASWCAVAGLFVRWAQYGQNCPRDCFWRFVSLTWRQPVTEAVFTECFGLDFARAESLMRDYLYRMKTRQGQMIRVLNISETKALFSDFTLRPATEAEVARLKGNFERMQMNDLRAGNPELAAKYEDAARRSLRRGLRFAPDDAQIRCVLGQLEYDTGHPLAARPHLEAAFAAKTAGTRALLALAHLRLDEARRPRAPGAKLPAEVVEAVLTPLFAARERKPAVVDVYKLIAEVWSQSAVAPTRGHLAVLLEGVQLFPGDTDYLLTAGEVHQQFGFTAEAAALAKMGRQAARTPEERERFARMLTAKAQ